MEFDMTANKLIKLIALLPGQMGVTVAWAHPGHEHSPAMADRLLHAVQTDWLALIILLVSLGLAGYFYVRMADKE